MNHYVYVMKAYKVACFKPPLRLRFVPQSLYETSLINSFSNYSTVLWSALGPNNGVLLLRTRVQLYPLTGTLPNRW